MITVAEVEPNTSRIPLCWHCGERMHLLVEERRWTCSERREEARLVFKNAVRRRCVRYGPWLPFSDWEGSIGLVSDPGRDHDETSQMMSEVSA